MIPMIKGIKLHKILIFFNIYLMPYKSFYKFKGKKSKDKHQRKKLDSSLEILNSSWQKKTQNTGAKSTEQELKNGLESLEETDVNSSDKGLKQPLIDKPTIESKKHKSAKTNTNSINSQYNKNLKQNDNVKNKSSFFEIISETASSIVGSPAWLFLTTIIILIWGFSGLIIGFEDDWHSWIHTITSLITLMLMALLHYSQRKWEARMMKLEDKHEKILELLEKDTKEIKGDLDFLERYDRLIKPEKGIGRTFEKNDSEEDIEFEFDLNRNLDTELDCELENNTQPQTNKEVSLSKTKDIEDLEKFNKLTDELLKKHRAKKTAVTSHKIVNKASFDDVPKDSIRSLL